MNVIGVVEPRLLGCIDVPAKSRCARSQTLKGQDLRQRGLVATMRELLHAIFGMFKHQQPFDGAKVYAGREQPVPAPAPEPQEVACA
jgi:hypothetical protein